MLAQLFKQLDEPLGADPARQAARDHHRVVPGRYLLQAAQQLGAVGIVDLRPLAVDVGDPAIGLDQLEVTAGFTGHSHEAVGKPAPGDQRFERLQVVAAQKAPTVTLWPRSASTWATFRPLPAAWLCWA